jgi:aminopeptidase N
LFGFVDLSFKQVSGSFAHVVLDSKGLEISKIEGAGKKLDYSVDKGSSALGEAIKVVIPEDMKKGEFTIRVTYKTGVGAPAIHWLDASDTKGGQMPYMYT